MDTLVLSQGYEPLARVSWRQAMTLWVAGRVEVLANYSDRHVKTPSRHYALPSVIRFFRGLRRRKPGVKFSRDNVFLRDKARCQYCGRALSKSVATFDHVVPRAQGGRTSWENLVLACVRCNQTKGNRTPEEASMRLRSRPVRPRSLPGFFRDSIRFENGMPDAWRIYLGDPGG